MTKLTYALVGMKHWHSEALMRSMPEDEPITLVREPNNHHDPHAIGAWARGQQIGYIGRGQRQPTEEERAAGKKYIPGDENVALAKHIDEHGNPPFVGMQIGAKNIEAKLIAGLPPRVAIKES
jgi:hypothetical protein